MKSLIVYDPKGRLTAQKALKHSWFLSINNIPRPITDELRIIKKLKKFHTKNKALRISLRLLAQCSKPQNLSELTEKFFALDPLFSGAITLENLCTFNNLTTQISQSELESNYLYFL